MELGSSPSSHVFGSQRAYAAHCSSKKVDVRLMPFKKI